MTTADKLDELDTLYNPDICDLELNEHQGKELPVIYLKDAKKVLKDYIQISEVLELAKECSSNWGNGKDLIDPDEFKAKLKERQI